MLATDSLSKNAMGGTELMKFRLLGLLDKTHLDQVQLFVSRVEEQLDETKIRLLWIHDLPGDPASDHLKNGGWKRFHKLIFVSNWQMQHFINYYGIPWSHCIVIQNGIDPIPLHEKPNDGILRLAYWSTPHRGLELLVPAFEAVVERRPNLVLDVYSSFNLYGWGERDAQYKKVFDRCKEHPKINYHGSVSNLEIRKAIQKTHIFAYPSIWPETSCLSLIEAMSGGLFCIHSNLAALPETASNFTMMYQLEEDLNKHASKFATLLDIAVESYWNEHTQSFLQSQKVYTDMFYNFTSKVPQWEAMIRSLLTEPRELPKTSPQLFEYKVS